MRRSILGENRRAPGRIYGTTHGRKLPIQPLEDEATSGENPGENHEKLLEETSWRNINNIQ